MTVYEKLMRVQEELKAPKGQDNSFGKYNYRNCEDILEAVKPICKKNNALIVLSDDVSQIGERFYVKAAARFVDAETGEAIVNTAYAREEDVKKGMDGSQITGAASSYARKSALNGLLCIDDSKDSDSTNVGDNTDEEVKEFIPATVDQMRDMISFADAYAEMCTETDSNGVWKLLKTKYGFEHTEDISTELADKIIKQLTIWYNRKKVSGTQ